MSSPHCAQAPRQRADTLESDASWQTFLGLLPRQWEAQAQRTGAFTRRRVVRSPAQWLRLLLVATTTPWSLAQVCLWARAVLGLSLSVPALRWRLGHARAWLLALLTEVLAQSQQLGVALSTVRPRILVVDSTTVRSPGPRGMLYRIQASFEVGSQHVSAVVPLGLHTGESLTRVAIAPGTIVLADRGFSRSADLAHILNQQGAVVVRLNTGAIALYHAAQGTGRCPLETWLTVTPGSPCREYPVWVQAGTQRVPLRLLVSPLPAAQCAQADQRWRHAAQKQRGPHTTLSRWSARSVVLLTSLDATTWPATAVVALYRWRWQIELLFKRWKSVLALAPVRVRTPALLEVTLLARLLVAVVVERWALVAFEQPLDTEPPHWPSLWRRWAVLRAAYHQALLGQPTLARLVAAWTQAPHLLALAAKHRRCQTVDCLTSAFPLPPPFPLAPSG